MNRPPPLDPRARLLLASVIVAGGAAMAVFLVMSVRGSSFTYAIPVVIAAMVCVFADRKMNSGRGARGHTDFLPAYSLGFLGATAGLAVMSVRDSDVPGWLALVPAVLGLLCARTLWRSRRLRRTFLEHGAKAPGLITDFSDHDNPEGDNYYEKQEYTVEFTDLRGQRQLVKGVGHFRSSELPQVGDELTVHFNPDEPTEHIIELASGDIVD
ncbi:DUF3592 domain-containing protein [Streptomyces sp. DSM 44915]|uniref:DUF3592 domain-containing protein n=1 Tax=Streptomyces chisholmiae TaxID=3075540 RepID=A0ABU2JT70_9ACTN|nr:DUF3592 domain-containing protein [Streptomyces sp. DSM 44915]MDT0267924.1 DUF3592 domain-containing protein [Streptomyces sp. DSM 44915]